MDDELNRISRWNLILLIALLVLRRWWLAVTGFFLHGVACAVLVPYSALVRVAARLLGVTPHCGQLSTDSNDPNARPGYVCTIDAGHDGDHVAEDDRVGYPPMHTWRR